MSHPLFRHWRFFLFGLAVSVLSGCAEQQDLERRVVTGRVTYQGIEIESGEIRFIPVQKGPVSAARILNGAYEVTHQGGVMLGSARVEIIATPDHAPLSLEELERQPASSKAKTIPKQYNDESNLQVDVQQGSGKQTLDFDLTGRSASLSFPAVDNSQLG
ncbi:MAG: hypothetical protein ACIALR_04080 [Blastopirellula sp. JB062]